MTHKFDKLSDRQRYGSNRRSALLSKLIDSGDTDSLTSMYSLEVELDRLLKRRLGYSEWDSNWDVGLHLKGDNTFLLLSKKNDLGSYEVIEKVQYSKELDSISWILDCLTVHKNK